MLAKSFEAFAYVIISISFPNTIITVILIVMIIIKIVKLFCNNHRLHCHCIVFIVNIILFPILIISSAPPIIFFLSSSFSRYIPNTGSRTDPEVSVSPANCLKEVIESATLNPLCYPNSYWAELQCEPLSLLSTEGAWLDSLPQVINICPNSESLRGESLST